MAMDFFEHQEAARKKTGLLVFYFALAVILIIAAVYLLIGVFVLRPDRGGPQGVAGGFEIARLWDWELFGAVSIGTLAVVGGGTAYRISSLSGGGHSVAELLGGKPIDPATRDPEERRLLNVVEEMAIAAGTPVPPVYILEDEDGINAFAAGYQPADAVIGVTRGAVRTLTRDELQGVVAHEFSHILNGDMRLNIKLMGVLYGIMLISILGWVLFRSGARSRYYARSRDNRDNQNNNALPLIGLGLYVVGFIGLFFGRLIKAAVSRQREYLADSSAVQFTRNPEGIAGALKKIGALAEGSRVKDPEAEEASHMFFGEALGLSASNPMASHPPLVDRIKRLDPRFDGDFSQVSLAPPTHAQVLAEDRAQATRGRSGGPRGEKSSRRFDPVEAITKIGTLGPQNLAYAAALLDSIPGAVVEHARDPFGAAALIYALLLDEDVSIRNEQVRGLADHAAPPALRELQIIIPQLQGLSPEARLPLVELAIPALRRLSLDQFNTFVEDIRHLMEADKRISLFEYALRHMLLRHLGPQFGWGERQSVRHTAPAPLVGPLGVLLSAIARVGQPDEPSRRSAYDLGAKTVKWPSPLPPLRESDGVGLKAVDDALKVLAVASPPLKKAVLTACATTIGADGKVTLEEGELLRAVADALDCPMPPLMTSAPDPDEPT